MIKDKVLNVPKMNWRALEWFQDSLKQATPELFESLKNSIKKNGIERSFKGWKTKGKIFVLDGHLMFKVLKNLGQLVPDKLSVELIDCKDEKDAAGKVLRYSSVYHKIAEQGLFDFQQKYELDLPSLNLNLPEIDLEYISNNFQLFEDPKEKEIDENIGTENECPKCGYRF